MAVASSSTARESGGAPCWYAVHTRTGAECRVADALQDLPAVEEVLVPTVKGGAAGAAAEPLFPSYVFFLARMSQGLSASTARIPEARYLVGMRPGTPSAIPEQEMRVVRYVAGLERDVRLGPIPERGRRARVVTGPLEGVEGIVVWRNKREARVASAISVVGQAVEIVVPLDWVVLADYETGGVPYKKTHRAGRRGRKSTIREMPDANLANVVANVEDVVA
ncbi:MAG: hypothetical protein PWP23_1228 [Candidatus Sumerlaeota bacterium]|nr:hypothetical protein [Candidatus Sumerlaeota bacterium]